MKCAPHLALAAALPWFAGGCLEFEEQTMSYRYGVESDELRIFQVYRGIFGVDGGPTLSGDEQKQLDSVLGGERTFFFANWIFEIDLAALRDFREQLKDPQQTDFPAADRPALTKLLDTAVASIRIENGATYLDGEGRLSGVQSVTVSKASDLLAAINACTPALLKAQAAEEATSPADRLAIEAFLRKGDAKLVHRQGNRFSLTWPMSPASYEEEFGAAAENQQRLREIRAAGIGISFEDGVATFSVGDRDADSTSITLTFSNEKYRPNAVGAVKEKRPVEPAFDPVAAGKTFLLGAR